MQIWVTNETSDLSRSISDYFQDVVNYDSSLDFFRTYSSLITSKREISSFDPTLAKLINQSETDLIVHSPPMTIEQAIKNPQEAIRILLEGAWRIAEIVKNSNLKLVHINFPVYSEIKQKETLLYFLNRSIKDIYDVVGINYVVLNPPILYSHKPNNMIYSLVCGNDEKKFFIDSEQEKPFMHMDDFVKIIDNVISNFETLKDGWWDVPPSEVISFEEVLDTCGIYHRLDESKDLYFFNTVDEIVSSPLLKINHKHKLVESMNEMREKNG